MRRSETMLALAALAVCLFAAAIAALVIGTDFRRVFSRRPPDYPSARQHVPAEHGAAAEHGTTVAPQSMPKAIVRFADIGDELERHRHLPEQGLDGSDPRRQHAVLCAVGDVRIALRLPAEQVQLRQDGPTSVLECRPDGDGAWKFVSVTAGHERPCGGAAVRQGRLTAWLDAREPVTEPGYTEQWRAREAVAGAVVAISDPERHGHETHVQLGRPVEHGPFQVRRFFFDATLRLDESAGGKPLLRVESPACPWTVDLRLDGACGTSSSSSSVSHAGRFDVGADPPRCTLRWGWSGAADEPFMETTLTLGPAGRLSSRSRLDLPLRLASSRVLDPWDSYRRLADVLDVDRERPVLAVLPDAKDFDIASARIPRADGAGIGVITQFADVVDHYRGQVPGLRQALHESLRKLNAEESLPVSMWQDRLRAALRNTAGFRGWAARTDGHRPSSPPGDADLSAYWSHLKADLPAHRNEATEVALCCMLEELDAVPDGKRAARRLLADLGSGDATFGGDLGVNFAGIGRSVLVSFGRHRSPASVAADLAPGATPQ